MILKIGDDRLFTPVEGGIADTCQPLVGEYLDRHEIAAGRANDDFNVGDFHGLSNGGNGAEGS